MPTIKKGDFIEIEYTGKVKEGLIVFDTTDEKIAKENELYTAQGTYGPVVVCLGQEQLLKGLEEELEGKETGKEYTIELPPEKAFGKKNAKLIRMIPYSTFKKQGIEPQPGLQVNVDGAIGIVKTAGGRCLVDFNNPLAGRDIIYQIKINKIITDDKEKISSFLKLSLNLKEAPVEIKENKAEIKLKTELPKEIQERIKEKLLPLVPAVKEINFAKKEEKKQAKPEATPAASEKEEEKAGKEEEKQ
ncbi:FKBP-type peptidyl-prolyl cis-trans isomerase [Candidatus Woesearchaeota archaeon]|nr:FKBP-type peptidyl-prolyl cis-trans isomerase [Candidatus Woesearchaeota archaeon]